MGLCCDPGDCGPCCMNCPTCPTLVRTRSTKQISALQASIHQWALVKEWRGPNSSHRPLVADLALFTSEISEALEELRKNADPTHYYESFSVVWRGVKFKNMSPEQLTVMGFSPEDMADLDPKPEGFGPEIADLVIRVLETCEEYGIDLSFEIERKMAHNEGRELKHGGLLM